MESQFDHITKVLAQATSRRRALRGIGGGLLGGVLATLGARKAWAANDNVTICHVPPGNPGNTHTITVAPSAIPAHLRHGDGVCAPGNEDCCFNSGTSTAICTNLATDTSNCGVCGNVCSPLEACVSGACEERCPCVGGNCGNAPSCSPDPNVSCVCFETVEGEGFCHQGQSCIGSQPCVSSAECPPGFACSTATCCGPVGICIQPCPPCAGQAAKAALAPISGPTTTGR